jgi:hypothetical protein
MRSALVLMTMLWLAGCCSPPAVAQAGMRSVDQVRSSGSLRGTDLDGDWGLTRVQPDPALLRRFDHLLTAGGEVDLREMRTWIAREVTLQRDAATASQVVAAWDAHLSVLQGQPTPAQDAADNPFPQNEPARPRKPHSPPAAPRALLMPDPPTSTEQQQALQAQRVQRFGTEAAERLRTEDAARWAWAQRLARARAQLHTLAGLPAEQEVYLARQFSGSELLRARTLLGLPP